MEAIKCVAVGDGGVGKTCLFITYTTYIFPTEYVPPVFDNYTAILEVLGGKTVQLGLWDTVGRKGYEKLRPFSYPGSDILLVCFSISNRSSFENIKDMWKPEIQHHCPGVPFILVGTKQDLRETKDIIEKREKNRETTVSFEEGVKMAVSIGAAKYMECSSFAHKSINVIFDEVGRIAVMSTNGAKGCYLM